LEKAATSRAVYFPKAAWFDWRTGKAVSDAGGETIEFESTIGVFGHVIGR
jgi:alpha-glucosidase (family GH31 glycosyl hydrolase)